MAVAKIERALAGWLEKKDSRPISPKMDSPLLRSNTQYSQTRSATLSLRFVFLVCGIASGLCFAILVNLPGLFNLFFFKGDKMAIPRSPYWLCQGAVFLLGLLCAYSIASGKDWLPAMPKMWRVVLGAALIGLALFLSQAIVYRFLGFRETITGYSLHYFLGVGFIAFGLFVYTKNWQAALFIGLMFSEVVSFLLPAVVDKFFYLYAWQYDGLYFCLRNASLGYICALWFLSKEDLIK